jgi:hypothetical protein
MTLIVVFLQQRPEGQQYVYTGMWHATTHIMRHEGWTGFFKGMYMWICESSHTVPQPLVHPVVAELCVLPPFCV